MEQRISQVADAMRRMDHIIVSRPALLSFAGESLALTRFRSCLADFDALAQLEVDSAIAASHSRRVLKEVVANLELLLDGIDSSAKVATGNARSIGDSIEPPRFRGQHPMRFSSEVIGYLKVAETHKDDLIQAGMHPRTIEWAREACDQFGRTHKDLSHAEYEVDVTPELLKLWRPQAIKRCRQLSTTLAPAMNGLARKDWVAAAALGRTHRAKALPAPTQTPLLGDGNSPPPESTTTSIDGKPARPESTTTSINEGKSGFAQRTKRAILRVIAGSEESTSAAEHPDATVSDIRRLPASTAAVDKTGTDGI